MNSTLTETSPALLQAIVDHSLTNIYAARAVRDTQTGELVDFQIYVSNPAFCRRVRYSQTNLQSHTLLTLFPVLLETGFFAAYRQVVETGEPFEGEQEYPGPQGHFWYQTAVKKLEDGILVNFIDITEQKEATLTLQRQAQLLDGIFNGSLNGLFALKAIRNPANEGGAGPIIDFQIIQANQMAARMTHQPVEGMLGQRFSLFFPGYLPSGLFEQYVRTIETGQRQETELYYPYDNVAAWYWIGSMPYQDGVIITFQDITDRRQAEQQRDEQNLLINSIFNGSLNGQFAMKAVRDDNARITDFQVVAVNRVGAALARKSADALIGRPFSAFFPGYKPAGLFEQYVRTVESGQAAETELYYPYDQAQAWYWVGSEPFGDGVILTFLDITQRKQAQLAAEQQTALLQTTLDASISSILAMTAIRNEQGQIIDFRMDKANRAVERSLGKTPAQLEGRTLLSVYPGNVDSGFFALYAKAADTGEFQQTTQHYTDVNGYEGWFEASAVRHGPDKIVLTFMNVTDYKQTERLVRQQSDLLQSVLDTTLNTVTTYQAVRDPQSGQIVDFRFTLANQAALEVIELTADELYTKTLLEVSPDLLNHAVFDQYVSVVQTGLPTTLERYRQGRWFLANAVRFGADGLLTSSMDITALKQAQHQIVALNQQLQVSNASLDQFAAVASHDLQEPLRKIKSFGDLLLDQYAPGLGEGAGLLRRMQLAADRMQTLIRDLLAFARLSKEPATAFQPIDLNHIVGEVITDLELTIAEKGVVLELAPLPTLPGDGLQLRQLFQNLLSNAVKFTQPGRLPTVRLTARVLDANELPDEAGLALGAYWQITVADNGIGFKAQYRQQIFGAFERLHGRTSEYGGTGIGLAIVRKVMENHQGAVMAESVEGQGATFRLFFPDKLK